MRTFKEFLNNYISNIEDIKELVNENKIKNNEKIIKEAEEPDDVDYFFKNILFFTNDRDSRTNKTLKNLEEAVKGKGVEIFPFVAEEVDYKATDDKIEWHDNENKYKVDEQSNIDTIVITRLGAQDSEECMELIKELQDWGFFVLNPIQSAKKASNKYQSSVLMERYEIPQPRFTLISKNDIEQGEESLQKKLKEIYPDIGDDEEKDKKL
jgi:glutathione synthase/RimK-type ligase-like ATP-grasp enzyme